MDQVLDHQEHKLGGLLYLWLEAGGTIDTLNSVLHGAGGHTAFLERASRARLTEAMGAPSERTQRERAQGERAMRASRSISGSASGEGSGSSSQPRTRYGNTYDSDLEGDIRAAIRELRGA